MLAQVDQLDSRQLRVLDDARGRVRNQDLAPATGVADAGGAVHADPHVTVLAEMWLGSVKAHSHAHFRARGPHEPRERALRGDRSLDGAPSVVERHEEAIASGVDLPSAVRCELVAQKPTLVSPDSGERVVTDAPQKIRRPLDVTEEEGHSATRQRLAAHCGHFRIQRDRPDPNRVLTAKVHTTPSSVGGTCQCANRLVVPARPLGLD